MTNSNDYRIVKNVSDIRDRLSYIDKVDLSKLDLRDYSTLFTGKTNFNDKKSILGWTDNVIWPYKEKMPEGFNPQELLENGKYPTEMKELHKKGINGKGVNIAIVDGQKLNSHSEYDKNIKYYEVLAETSDVYHGSLVAGCAVGKNTGTAPEAGLYYFSAKITKNIDDKMVITRENANKAIKKILDINKQLSENDKIRFISCSFGSRSDLFYEEAQELFRECENSGIMVLGASYIERHFQSIGKNEEQIKDRLFDNKTSIPTDGKTTPFYNGGYLYHRLGGASSTFPYIAGVFACALQNNINFILLPRWQDKMFQIMHETALTNENGCKIINPKGIVDNVTELTNQLNIQLQNRRNFTR